MYEQERSKSQHVFTFADLKVSIVVYNEDTLFRSQHLTRSNTSLVVSGPIISATVLNKTVANLSNPVVIETRPTKVC